MNESTIEEPVTDRMADCGAEMDDRVRRNPGTALLIAAGAGLAIGLIVRALRPEPTPRNRAMQLLKDLEARLRDVTEPALRKAGEMASDGASVVQDGLHNGSVGLKRAFHDARKRVVNLFS
jgi:ElaB/YqjD/DUF883 family membrane-anchored ribosome-binding protein